MKAAWATKKNGLPRLDLTMGVRIILCMPFIFYQESFALQYSTPSSGAINVHGFQRTSYFFSKQNEMSPSFLVRESNGDYLLLLKRPLDSYQFKIRNGIIEEATIERHIKSFRSLTTFQIINQKYKLKRFAITNHNLFAADASCPSESETVSVANLAGIGTVSEALERHDLGREEFVSASCKDLNSLDLQNLSKLKKIFEEKDHASSDLKACLNDTGLIDKISKIDKAILEKSTSSPSRIELLRDAISLVGKSFEGRIEKTNRNLIPLTIECKINSNPQNKSPAIYDANSGRIIFYLKAEKDSGGKDQLLSKLDLKHTFTHEFVHLSLARPNKCSAQLEDEFAEDIARVCEPISESLAKIGVTEIDNPFAPEPSLSDTKRVEQVTAIKIAEVANSIPIQRVDPASLDFVGELPNTASSPRAVNNSLQASVAGPISNFARAADQVAALMIPKAEAKVKVAAGKAPTIIEDTVYPDPGSSDPNRFLMQTTVSKSIPTALVQASSEGESLIQSNLATMNPKSPRIARGPASEGLGIESTGGQTLGSISVGSGSGQQMSQGRARMNSNIPQTFQVGGINFSNSSLSGEEYKKYFLKMKSNDQAFKSALEQNGILISRNGSVLTKPKQVALLYIDTGRSLEFGDY